MRFLKNAITFLCHNLHGANVFKHSTIHDECELKFKWD